MPWKKLIQGAIHYLPLQTAEFTHYKCLELVLDLKVINGILEQFNKVVLNGTNVNYAIGQLAQIDSCWSGELEISPTQYF